MSSDKPDYVGNLVNSVLPRLRQLRLFGLIIMALCAPKPEHLIKIEIYNHPVISQSNQCHQGDDKSSPKLSPGSTPDAAMKVA